MLNIFFHAEKNWLYRTSPDIEYIHRMRKWQDTHANGDEPRADWELCRLLSDVSLWFGLLDEFVLFVFFRGVWIVCKISWRATCQLLLGWRLESQWYRYMWLMYFNIIAYIDWRYFFKSWNTSFFSHFFFLNSKASGNSIGMEIMSFQWCGQHGIIAAKENIGHQQSVSPYLQSYRWTLMPHYCERSMHAFDHYVCQNNVTKGAVD